MNSRNLDSNNPAIHAIAGGTGLIGSALAERVADSVVLTRSADVDKSHFVQWDPARKPSDQLTALSRRFASVVCVTGMPIDAKRWNNQVKEQLLQSRLQPLQCSINLLRNSQHHKPTLIIASGVGVYPASDRLCDETTSLGDTFLARLSETLESEAQKACQYGIRVVILRIGVVMSVRKGALAKMLPLFRLGLGGKLGAGTQWFSWISLADIVGICQYALENSHIAGIYNATSPNPVTNAQFTQAVAKALDKPAFLTVPAFALRLAMGEVADTLLGSNRVIPQKLIEHGYEFVHPTIDQAVQNCENA